jgi:septum formation protein
MSIVRSYPLWTSGEPLILASGSSARAQMLNAAGIPFEIDKPTLDERAVEAPLRAAGANGAQIAAALAQAKALEVSARRPGRYVLGGDQTLQIDDDLLAKPEGRAGAHAHLRLLSGRSHQLHAAGVLARDGDILLAARDTATLTMRALSDVFIETYLDAAGDAVLGSVGAYQIEGLGLHLFTRIEGQHPVIMGLPLQSLIEGLRNLSLLSG